MAAIDSGRTLVVDVVDDGDILPYMVRKGKFYTHIE